MNLNDKYKLTYEIARDYLFNYIPKDHPELTKFIIRKHLKPKLKPATLNEVFRILVSTISNRQFMKNVINFKEKESALKKTLFNFDPHRTIKRYKNPNNLLARLKKHFELNLFSKQNKLRPWKIFSEGIISGAQFLSKFNDKTEFERFVDAFMYSTETKAALPMVLGKLIKGIGFALPGDFLKNIGYKDYPKPDEHLTDIFKELRLCKSDKQYDVYKSIVEMAEVVGETAYTVDATFWLISSGNFYMDGIKIKGHKNEFIKFTRKRLKKHK